VLKPWLQLFRVPNLPTAVGDAVAGGAAVAAFCLRDTFDSAVRDGVVRAALAAGLAELLLYLGGLADNDLIDEAADRAAGSDRPLATGALSRKSVRAARLLCFAAAGVVGLAFRLGAGWWACAATVLASILAYDRVKERMPRLGPWLMGLCRGLAVASGAAAAIASFPSGNAASSDATALWLVVVGPMVLGWTLYTAAVTRLGAGEEQAAAPLGSDRYLPAANALVPAWFAWAAILSWAVWSLRGHVPVDGVTTEYLAPLVGCLAAMATWCAAVAPLGKPHGPRERGRAVGRAIGGLLWMQTGFLCFQFPRGAPIAAFVALAATCWLARLAIRRAWPAITGS